MTKSNQLLWRWIFGSFDDISQVPAFNPAAANQTFNHYSGCTLFITAIRCRGLHLRRQHGKAGRAMAAVMEVAAL